MPSRSARRSRWTRTDSSAVAAIVTFVTTVTFGASVLIGRGDALARPKPRRAPARIALWLQSNGYPLARVEGGAITGPRHAIDCKKDAVRRHRQWRAVDAHGRLLRDVQARSLDYYDVNRCWSPVFLNQGSKPGSQQGSDPASSRLYLSQGAEPPLATQAFLPSQEQREGLAILLMNQRQKQEAAREPWQTEARTRLLRRPFWFSYRPSQGEPVQQYAVVGTDGLLLITRWDGRAHTWRVLHRERPRRGFVIYQPVAAFDMNRNGRVDIVVHDIENAGETSDQRVLECQSSGCRLVATGVFDSSA
jgi:hypothetical protein